MYLIVYYYYYYYYYYLILFCYYSFSVFFNFALICTNMYMLQVRLILNVSCLVALIIHEFGLGNKGN